MLIWGVRGWNEEDEEQNCLDQSQKIHDAGNNSVPLKCTVKPLQELLGHEGSIYRISWSEDGLCVASASDDRRFVMLFKPLPYGQLITCSKFCVYGSYMVLFASNFQFSFVFLIYLLGTVEIKCILLVQRVRLLRTVYLLEAG